MEHHFKKVLITGSEGFTGRYLTKKLNNLGYSVTGTTKKKASFCKTFVLDINDESATEKLIRNIEPDYIIHLAAISYVGHSNALEFYKTNVIGTETLLKVCARVSHKIKKIILASSANVYGNTDLEKIPETSNPSPVNHYACSKLAMEQISKNYQHILPIIVVRPFNYTGPGQNKDFIIPKLVSHFKLRKESIELGNIKVYRDFSDINFIVDAYSKLLDSEYSSEVFNLCSGSAYSIEQLIQILQKLSGHSIKVDVNPNLVRKNDITFISGDNKKLLSAFPTLKISPLSNVLREMYYG